MRDADPDMSVPSGQRAFTRRLARNYALFALSFLALVGALAFGEAQGLSHSVIGYVFLFATIAVYAVIGIGSRTSEVDEYHVAGRRVPPVFNGMATAADWMSAASFIGLAGSLYHAGFQGLAFLTGWTGGFVLVALLLAPYLRRFGQYTIPDFLGARYEGHAARLVGAGATVLASFVYLVAQIYAVGLITSRFVSVEFEIGLFIGLAGMIVCSFLGGMRAVTWTQVAQYIILIVAYLVPVMLLSYKFTGMPLPQVTQGSVIERLAQREDALLNDWREGEVRELHLARADAYAERIERLPDSLEEARLEVIERVNMLIVTDAPARDIARVERELRDLPLTPETAAGEWQRAREVALERARVPARFTEAYPESDDVSSHHARNNFIALVFVLMAGTAALPHLLMRLYTTPGAADARRSVSWSLFFICLLYLTAPAYAIFVKWEVYGTLVGSSVANLPDWVASWGKIGLVTIEDINGDGIVQLAEIALNPDVIVLAAPEIAGLPYVVAGLIAAGGLAAALSTADGLLLAIANAFSHDFYFKVVHPAASAHRRLVVAKSSLLVVAIVAAWVASLRPDNILFMVGLAFSLAASAFFPALVGGIFWQRANRPGAIAAMIAGLVTSVYYVTRTHPFFGGHADSAWFGIEPVAAGVFGMPVGAFVLFVVSLATAPPGAMARQCLERIRTP